MRSVSRLREARVAACVMLAGLIAAGSGAAFAAAPDDPARVLVATMKRQLQLPRTIDDVTRLDDIRAGPREIRYYLTLGGVPAETRGREAAFERLRRDVAGDACSDASNRRLHAAGLAVAFYYCPVTGPPFPAIRIAPAHCPPSQ